MKGHGLNSSSQSGCWASVSTIHSSSSSQGCCRAWAHSASASWVFCRVTITCLDSSTANCGCSLCAAGVGPECSEMSSGLLPDVALGPSRPLASSRAVSRPSSSELLTSSFGLVVLQRWTELFHTEKLGKGVCLPMTFSCILFEIDSVDFSKPVDKRAGLLTLHPSWEFSLLCRCNLFLQFGKKYTGANRCM